MSEMFARFDDYDFRHFVADQAEFGEAEIINRLFGYQNQNKKNSWFSIRSQRNELSGYLDDLETATSLVNSSANRRTSRRSNAVALQARYALIKKVITSLAGNHPPQLYAHYIKSGLWTVEQALTWARFSNDPKDASDAIISVLNEFEVDKIRVANLALSRVSQIGDPDNRLWALVDIIEDIPEQLMETALRIIENEENEGSKLGVLVEIAEKLPYSHRLSLLKIANKFDDAILKAEALFGIASSLAEPDRVEAINLALNYVKQAEGKYLKRKNKTSDEEKLGQIESSWESSLSNLAWELSPEILEKLPKLLTESYLNIQEVLVCKQFERIAETEPDHILSNIDIITSPRTSVHCKKTLQLAIFAFVSREEYSKAFSLLNRMPTVGLGPKADTFVELWILVPQTEYDKLIDIFKSLVEIEQRRVLRILAVDKNISRSSINPLLESFSDEKKCHQAMAVIGPLLSLEELNREVQYYLRNPDFIKVANIKHLAPFLTINHIHKILTKYPDIDHLNRNFFKELLLRLAVLGEPIKAIDYVANSTGILDYERKEIFAKLAESIPGKYLTNILEATQPISETKEMIMARIALIRWLPSNRVEQILQDIASVRYVTDRVKLYCSIPLDLRPKYLEIIGRHLIVCIQETFQSQSLDKDEALTDGFRYLSQILSLNPSSELTKKALELAQADGYLSQKGKVLTLLDLASSGGSEEHVQKALKRAILLSEKEPSLLSLVQEYLTVDHVKVISDLVRYCSTPDELSSFLIVGAHVLDEDAKQLGKGLVDQIASHNRLAGLDKLLRNLSHEDREQLIDQELMFLERGYRGDWELWASTMASLVRYRSNLFRKHKSDLIYAFRRLTLESKVQIARAFAESGIYDFVEWSFEAIFTTYETERFHLLQAITPVLNTAHVTRTVNWLKSKRYIGVSDLRVALILRAVKLGEDELILSALSQLLEEPLVNDTICKHVTHHLPSSLIPQASELVRDKSSWQNSLAVRAAETGDIGLALHLFDKRGGSSSNDQTFEKICGFASKNWVDQIVSFSEEKNIKERSLGLAKLVSKIPKYRRKELTIKVTESASNFRPAQFEKRLKVIRTIEPELKNLSLRSLISLWTDALKASSKYGRSEILIDICAFSPIFVARFGSEMALKLDDAVNLTGRDTWP